MYVILGKLDIPKFSLTAFAVTKDEVAEAIMNAWIKHCKVAKIEPFGAMFKNEKALKKSIEYLMMEVGIAYCLYKK